MLGRRKKVFPFILLFLVTFIAMMLLELGFFADYEDFSLHSKIDQNKQFLDDWCRLHNWRFDWEGFLEPCINQLDWSKRQIDSAQRSDVHESFIKSWSIKPAGKQYF